MNNIDRVWPNDAAGKVPYWVYSDPDVYAAELERIWYGPHWLFCALEAEIPEVGDFKTTTLGERPVIVVRSGPDEVSVLENRCAHRGVKFCQARKGHVKDLLCPYHQWNYSLRGDLQGAAFRRGVRGQGGMPDDFDPKNISLRKLRVEVVNGLVWATFSDAHAAISRIPRGALLAALHARLRWSQTASPRLQPPAHSRQLEADAGEHQGPLSRVPAARFLRNLRAVSRRPEIGDGGRSDGSTWDPDQPRRPAGDQRRHLRHAHLPKRHHAWPIRASWMWCRSFPAKRRSG